MRLTFEPIRYSLFAALGLLACSPGEKGSGEESDAGSGSASDTGTAPTTGAGTTAATTGPGSTSETGATGSASDSQGETGATSAGETGAPVCANIEPALQGFTDPPVPSGFERCDGGILHRAEKVTCETPTTPNSCMDNSGGGCLVDADCVEKPFGSCQQDMIFGGVLVGGTCSCNYGCQTDADCAEGQLCRCAGDGLGLYTQCIAAGCLQDSDCPPGELCGLAPDICAPGGFLTACTTPADLCAGDADCANPPCSFDGTKWDCANAACGRPFLVDAQALTAPAARRDDWRALQAAPRSVSPELAARLASYWIEIGRLEHASVAAFAQFVLQLLAVAAPPELVLAAQQALADEVEHARLAFGLASLYSGTGVGPGPLASTGAGAATSLPELLDAVIREACLGETLAAFEAREAAERAEDPAVQAALRKIAGDEQRHAELGWRFVQWALTGADPQARARAQATFAAALAEARHGAARDAAAAGTPELHAHGVIDAPLRAQIWTRGLAEVIEPCAAALLGRRAA
jgi:hypothetical protein